MKTLHTFATCATFLAFALIPACKAGDSAPAPTSAAAPAAAPAPPAPTPPATPSEKDNAALLQALDDKQLQLWTHDYQRQLRLSLGDSPDTLVSELCPKATGNDPVSKRQSCLATFPPSTKALPAHAIVEIRVSEAFELDDATHIAWFAAATAKQPRDTRGPLMLSRLSTGGLLVVPFISYFDCTGFSDYFDGAGSLILTGIHKSDVRAEFQDSPVQFPLPGIEPDIATGLRRRLADKKGFLRVQLLFEPKTWSTTGIECGTLGRLREGQAHGFSGRAIGYRLVDDLGMILAWLPFGN